MKTNIIDYIDFDRFNALLEGFNKSTGFVTAILDLKGNIISKSGWRSICTDFHRVNKESNLNCILSDTILANSLSKDKEYNLYKCHNGLIDVVVPINIKGEHVANLFTGQFFLEEPDIAFFEEQATKYGFNKRDYLNALDEVPIVSEKEIKDILDFLLSLTQMVIDLTIEKIEKENSESLLKMSLESPVNFIILAIDKDYNYLYFNKAHKEVMQYAYDSDIEIGMNLIDAISSDIDKVNAKRNYGLALTGKSHTTVEEYGDINKEYYESLYNPIYGEDNQIIGATVFARNVTERFHLEKDLKESKERFEILHNASFGGIAVHDKGVILECNQGLSDITGFSIDELIGMDGLLLIAPDYRSFVMDKITSGYEKPYEAFGIRKNEEIYPLKLEARNIPYEGKQVRVVEFRDITELKQQEKAKAKIEEQYGLLTTEMPLGLNLREIIYDDQGNPIDYLFLSANAAYEKMTGLKRENILGRKATEVLPSIEEYWFEKYGKVVSRGESIQFEDYSQAVGRYFNVTAYPLQKGQFVVIVDDITSRKQLEIEVLKEKETLRATLNSIGDAVIATDDLGIITGINPVASKLTGWLEHEAVGKPFDEVFKITFEDKNKPIKNPVEEVLKTNKVAELANHTILISKDNTEYYIEDTAAPIKDSEGNNIGVVLVFRDVTEKKKTEREIRYLSEHDYLTGVYNRRFFQNSFDALINNMNLPIAIMMIDVNGLKIINDAYGHNVGDMALKIVSNVLNQIFSDNEVIARLGGDEFAVLFSDPKSLNKIQEYKNQINESLSKHPINKVAISLAIGYAISSDPTVELDEIFKEAENEMYRHKISVGVNVRSKTIKAIFNTLTEKYELEKEHSIQVS
ncbi:MAG: PocR ligand-binding domain-containing protein, partial [Bacillota bacterium]